MGFERDADFSVAPETLSALLTVNIGDSLATGSPAALAGRSYAYARFGAQKRPGEGEIPPATFP